MRVAIYARYSSDLQRDTSLEDQITGARRYAQTKGWVVADDHIYADAAVSGASIEGRPRLQAVSAHRRRPFLFLAEGVFMYLRETQVKSLVLTLRDHFADAGGRPAKSAAVPAFDDRLRARTDAQDEAPRRRFGHGCR